VGVGLALLELGVCVTFAVAVGEVDVVDKLTLVLSKGDITWFLFSICRELETIKMGNVLGQAHASVRYLC
jgi:hypothetical protein